MKDEKTFMYEKIYRDLLEKIQSGEYPAGSRLPSEKELTGQYGVSRITSKKALEMLAEEGLISRMPGRGSFVLEAAQDKKLAEKVNISMRLPERKEYKGKIIGVILNGFDCNYGANVLRSIEQECTKRNYNLVLKCTYDSIEMENQAIQSIMEIGAEGLLIMCAQNETYNTTILKLALEKYPIVFMDRKMNGIPIPCVSTDNYRASQELTEILIKRKHKNLCFVTHTSMSTSSIKERYEGFAEKIMEHAGISGCVLEVPGYNPTLENERDDKDNFDYEGMKKLMQNNSKCTGFLCIDAKLCGIVRRVAGDLGKKADIVAFDGTSEDTIAYVLQNEREIGIQAVEELEEIMNGECVEKDVYIPYTIIENDI